MMPWLLQEIILLDLLKVISHHGARLATPIRSVQRVLDEGESRSSPFRDMRNANQTQRRPLLLLDSQVAAASSDDDDEDDESDISETISRLSAQLSKPAKTTLTKDSDSVSESESERSSEDQGHLKTPSDVKKLKESVPVADENSRTPVTVQQSANGPRSDDSSLQETRFADSDVRETLMDRIHAGTEETLVKSRTVTASLQNLGENGKAISALPVAASHVPPPELVVELPEKVPHLYSNNVGLDDPSEQAGEPTSPSSSDDEGNEKEITTVSSLKVNIDVQSHLTEQDAVKTGSHMSTDVDVNDKHIGVHVAVASTLSVDDDPWRQPPTARTDEKSNEFNDDSALGGTSPASSDHDVWRQPSTTNESVASSNDPWTPISSVSEVHHNITPKAQPSRPTVDPNLIPGVAIDGPKHILPLDEDIITLDGSPTLVTLGKPNSSKERRESSGHGAPKGAASSDTPRDRER